MSCITTKKVLTLTATLPFSTKHIDEFITLKCARDLLPLFPNAKEITESMAVFHGIRRVKDVYPSIMADSSVLCVVPGDGVSPRTGAIAAFLTKWDVHSVDPLMRQTFTAKRLTCHTAKIENVKLETAGTVVILSTHSHAPLDAVLQSVKAKTYIVIAMQCCVPMIITGRTPIYEKRDCGVFSPENLVKVWKFDVCDWRTYR